MSMWYALHVAPICDACMCGPHAICDACGGYTWRLQVTPACDTRCMLGLNVICAVWLTDNNPTFHTKIIILYSCVTGEQAAVWPVDKQLCDSCVTDEQAAVWQLCDRWTSSCVTAVWPVNKQLCDRCVTGEQAAVWPVNKQLCDCSVTGEQAAVWPLCDPWTSRTKTYPQMIIIMNFWTTSLWSSIN